MVRFSFKPKLNRALSSQVGESSKHCIVILRKNPLGNPTCKPEFPHSEVLSPGSAFSFQEVGGEEGVGRKGSWITAHGAHGRPDISPMSGCGVGAPLLNVFFLEKYWLLSATPRCWKWEAEQIREGALPKGRGNGLQAALTFVFSPLLLQGTGLCRKKCYGVWLVPRKNKVNISNSCYRKNRVS